jgi:glucan endo-1,3-alpha-glucosidase
VCLFPSRPYTALTVLPSHSHSALPCASPTDAQALRTLVNTNAAHPNQLQYDTRAFVSTFAGETCTFGQSSVPNGWATQFAGNPELKGKIYFVPAFFVDPVKFAEFGDVMDGDFNVCLMFTSSKLLM